MIAERMNNEGQLTATDTSDSRLGLLRENCERLGVTCAALGQADAVEEVEVQWPNGESTKLAAPVVDKYHAVKAP